LRRHIGKKSAERNKKGEEKKKKKGWKNREGKTPFSLSYEVKRRLKT